MEGEAVKEGMDTVGREDGVESPVVGAEEKV